MTKFESEKFFTVIERKTIFFYSLIVEKSTSYASILPPKMLNDIKKRTNVSMDRYHKQETLIMETKTQLDRDSPAWYLAASHEMTPEAKNLTEMAIRRENMAIMLVEILHMDPKNAYNLLPSFGTTLVSYFFIFKILFVKV